MYPIDSPAVTAHFESYSPEIKHSLLQLRELIYDTAKEVVPDENITESLKWNQPSYAVKKGSPFRIDQFDEDKVALFFHCQTTLVETFRGLFPEILEFSKNRAIVLDPKKSLPEKELSVCIQMALTYHKKS